MKAKEGRPPAPGAAASEQQGNYSVAGEEDPGASPGCVPNERRQQQIEDAYMLRRAVKRWENEGGSEAGEVPEADASPETACPVQTGVELAAQRHK
jgi:hypothetical protein